MATHSDNLRSADTPGITQSLGQEYAAQQALFDAQPRQVQQFLSGQAHALAEALVRETSQVRFALPDRVALSPSGETAVVPEPVREQMAGGLLDSLTGADLRIALRHRLVELDGSSEQAVGVAAQLIRHATAIHMVHDMLPAGRSVTYVAAEGEEIPTEPVASAEEIASALVAESDSIAEEGKEEERGELVVPYVAAARRFYLPQWVAFDEEGNLLVKTAQEAEGYVASMQRFTAILHAAVALAPYLVADAEYQRKRYGILGQLINQGRALALYQTREIIQTIQRRAAADDLNRGLSLSLPYFDDQALQMKLRNFQVIPAGRIMFIPGLVVRAVRDEQVKVGQDTRLSTSTRKYLLKALAMLEAAFRPGSERQGQGPG
jgi:hypothetical protein